LWISLAFGLTVKYHPRVRISWDFDFYRQNG